MHARTNRKPVARNSPVVILVHGFVISSSYMVPTAHELAPSCRVYAPDLPGYGQSFRSREVLGPVGLADALAAWMDKMQIKNASLLANSYGCQVLTEFGIRHPAKIGKMVMVGPTVDPKHRTVFQQMFRLAVTARYEDPSLRKLNRKEYRTVSLKRILGTARHCLRHRMEERLPLVRPPVLVVRGSNDSVVNRRWGEEAARLLPHGELKVLPGGGHALNYSQPVELVRMVRPFLAL